MGSKGKDQELINQIPLPYHNIKMGQKQKH